MAFDTSRLPEANLANEAIIAVDLGAESGRVVIGSLQGRKLLSEEVHRFAHHPLSTPSGLCWDVTGLWNSILEGLRKAVVVAKEYGLTPRSVGVDAWGVDWTIISPGNTMRGLPRCYRDPVFIEACKAVLQKVSASEIYRATGIQLMHINSLFQVAHAVEAEPDRFVDGKLLFIPDLFHWMLSGRATVERTIASTSQMLYARTGHWAVELLGKLDLMLNVFSEPIDPGTEIGLVSAEVLQAIGCKTPLKVIAPPCHDTAAAVVAVPAKSGSNWAYLSSGTWSLLGAELPSPCITAESEKANFTNELGVNGTVRFLKNIAGLWLVQQCRKNLGEAGHHYNYATLVDLATRSEPFRTLVPANYPWHLSTGSLVDAMGEYARRTNQPVPVTPGELVRCCLESLALEYRRVMRTMQGLLNKKFDVLHIVGGGSKNELLSQMTADALGIPVWVGPAEATAMGNLLVQAMGLGLVKDLAALRGIVRETVTPVVLQPANTVDWEKVAARYEALPQT